MKTIKLSFAIIAVAIMAIAVAVVSCKKEKQDTASNNTEQAVQSADNMDEYLISFRKNLLSAQKGSEFISLEQAQCDLGNLLNFDFGDVNYATNEYRYDTIHLNLELTNGNVDLSHLASTYYEAVSSIIDVYNVIDLTEKSVYAVLCDFKESESKDSETEDVDIVLITRGLTTPINGHDTLDWRPKNWAGTCDGQFVNVCGGPETMRYWIYYAQTPFQCINGGRIYFTNPIDWLVFGYQCYDPVAGRFRIYTSFDPDQDHVCITHDEMEYYGNQICEIYEQGVPNNRYIMSISINHIFCQNCFIQALNEYRDCYSWKVFIRHGKPNCTGSDPLV